MKYSIVFLTAFLLYVLAAESAFGSNEKSIAKSLRYNVVAITAKWENGQTHHGFGWIAGVREGRAIIATANHIVRGKSPRAVDKSPTITLYLGKRPITSEAKLLPQNNDALDLAVIEMSVPERALWKFSVIDQRESNHGRVTYVGSRNKWHVPEETRGKVTGVSGPEMFVAGMDVDVGTSGSILVSGRGMVGMFISNISQQVDEQLATTARVLSIHKIKEQFELWQYPWSLQPFQRSPKVVEDWHYLFPGDDPIRAKVQVEPDAPDHYRFFATLNSGDRVADGMAVMDGNQFRLVYDSVLVPSVVSGELLVKATKLIDSAPTAVLIEGIISFTDEFDEPTTEVMRLAGLKSSNSYYEEASIYMKNNVNPEQDSVDDADKIAQELAASYQSSPANAAIVQRESVPSESQYVSAINQSVVAAMLQQMQVLAQMSGLSGVNFSVKENCILATGKVLDQEQVEKIDEFLELIAQRAGGNTKACNETTY